MPEPQGLSQPRQIIGHFATHQGDFGCNLPPSKDKQLPVTASDLAAKDDRIAALEAERDGQADQAATYRKRCRQYADQLAALEARISNLHVQLEAADSKSAALEAEVKELRTFAQKVSDWDYYADHARTAEQACHEEIREARADADRMLNKEDGK